MDHQLYFLAVFPHPEISFRIDRYRHLLAEDYHCRHVLKSPPHITVVSPFRCNAEQIENIRKELMHDKITAEPFEVVLNGFGHFRKDVLFINVEKNSPLEKLSGDLTSRLIRKGLISERKRGRFHAHLTIAFRDLLPEVFESIWPMYKSKHFYARFLCTGIACLRHLNKKWDEFWTINLA